MCPFDAGKCQPLGRKKYLKYFFIFVEISARHNARKVGQTAKQTLASLGIMGVELRASLKPPVHHSTVILRDLNIGLNWSPIMPRNARFSYSECEFMQSGSGEQLTRDPRDGLAVSIFLTQLNLQYFANPKPVRRKPYHLYPNYILTYFYVQNSINL